MKKISGLGLVLLCGIVLAGCSGTNTTKLEEKITKLEKNVTSLNKKIDALNGDDTDDNSDTGIAGKVKVPDPYFKTQEQVEAEFDKIGLKVKFVTKNFDDAATINKKKIYKGDCYQLEDGSGAEYFGSDEAGDDYGYYAEKGDTIIVGYTDHDFDGSKGKESSETKESSTKSSSSESKTSESKQSSKSESSGSGVTRLNISDSEIEKIETYKDYLDMYQKINKNYLTEYENVFKDTILYDEAAFTQMQEDADKSFEEQKKQYSDKTNAKLIGKDTLVEFLKKTRDGLADYVDKMSEAIN